MFLLIVFVLWSIVGIFAFRLIVLRGGLTYKTTVANFFLILLLSGPIVFLVSLYYFFKSFTK